MRKDCFLQFLYFFVNYTAAFIGKELMQMFIFKRIFKSMQKTERECDELHEQLQRDREYINESFSALINAQIEFQGRMKEVTDPFSEYLEELKEWIDAEKRLEESVELAREAGLPEDKILHNMEEGERFFCS